MNPDEARGRLTRLRTELDRLPPVTEPPSTTLQVLGEETSEGHWESLLVYFLDPGNPHGFDRDVLSAFLGLVADDPDTSFSFGARDLADARVDSQVGTEDGVPDVLVWVEGEWFLCIELKVRSGETDDQTVRYAESGWIGEVDKAAYDPADHHYLYLAPSTADPPASDAFARLTWTDVAEALRETLVDGGGRYPNRSHAQLADFVDTVREEFTMTEHQRDVYERAGLRVEFEDAIEDVDGALDSVVEEAQRDWQSDFTTAAVSCWDDGWRTSHLGNKYARLYRQEWLRDPARSDSEPLPKDAAAGVVLQFSVERDVFLEERLEVILKTIGGSEQEGRLEDHLYSGPVLTRLEEAADTAGATVRERSDRKEILFRRTPLRLSEGHTVGGRAAVVLDELSGVADVLTEETARAYGSPGSP